MTTSAAATGTTPPDGPTPSEESSEYETDSDAEPEEFYVTFDLTIPQPVTAGPASNPYTNLSRAVTTTSPSAPNLSKSRHVLAGSRAQVMMQRRQPSWARAAQQRRDKIQILDLDTDHPVVSYQNRMWSGHWARTLGSELFIPVPTTAATAAPAAAAPDVPETATAAPAADSRGPPRISGGGYYVSEKDFSVAAAYVGGRRGTHGKKLHEASDELVRVPMEPGTGRVEAVGDFRVQFSPAQVKAKEWSFAEQVGGRSEFLRRLERVQIQKEEIGEKDARWQEGRPKRVRRKATATTKAKEKEKGKGKGEGNAPVEREREGEGEGEGEGGYFGLGWETRGQGEGSHGEEWDTTDGDGDFAEAALTLAMGDIQEHAQPPGVDRDADVEMTSAPAPPPPRAAPDYSAS